MNEDYKKTATYIKSIEIKEHLKRKQQISTNIIKKGNMVLCAAILGVALGSYNSLGIVLQFSTFLSIVSAYFVLGHLYKKQKTKKEIKSVDKILNSYEQGEVIKPETHLKVLDKAEVLGNGYVLIDIPHTEAIFTENRLCKNSAPVLFARSELSKPLSQRSFGEPLLENGKMSFETELNTESKITSFIKNDSKPKVLKRIRKSY